MTGCSILEAPSSEREPGEAAWHWPVGLWGRPDANAVRRLTFRRPVFGTGSCFPGRPRHQFTRRELEDELSEAGFSPVAFWRWGPFGAVVCLNGCLNGNAPDPVRLVNCQ